ncbi:MAG: ParB N-terminal domain-containing protein [Lentisphaeria bacterium]|nr:ParB N-terminal domain-containing protein [Lentisphaeria bacterium]
MSNEVEMMNVDQLETRETFSNLFPIQKGTLDKITARMRDGGFQNLHPLCVWRTDKPVVLDGHTRLQAARQLGIEKVPVVQMDFDDELAAMEFAVAQQLERRNLSVKAMMEYIEIADTLARRGRKKREQGRSNSGENEEQARGKSSQRLAKALHIPVKRAECLRRIVKDGSEETKTALANEEISINQAYHDTLDRMNERKSATNPEQDEDTASAPDDDTPASQEEHLRRAEKLKEIRKESFAEGILSAIGKEVDYELKHYPSVRYSDAELASVKNTVMEKIDDILKRLAC